jgi:hypothetical protein
MLKHSLAILIATAVPAMAADNVLSSHEVRFEQESFICGQINDSGKVRRFIHSTPTAKYIPEFEPAATDPIAKSWDITYRIICEGAIQPPITARLNHKRF